MKAVFILVALVSGCTWVTSKEYDERVDPDADEDPVWSDCADSDPTIHNLATEICDGIDNDCDGEIDNDPGQWSLFFFDHDGDGYGIEAYTTTGCEAPNGYAAQAGDCDDDVAGVNPGATERCDLVDNDCDDVSDEADAVDAREWYVDADDDDYGADDSVVLACDAPPGAVDMLGDCDDTDKDVHPGGTDVCNDAIDGDCDGEVLPCTMDIESSGSVIVGDEDGAQTGTALATGDYDGDEVLDILIGAEVSDAASAEGGAAWLVLGPPATGVSSVADASVDITGRYGGENLGTSAALYDLDGDGYADLLVGAHNATLSATQQGAVFTMAGPELGTKTDLTLPGPRLIGEEKFDRAGRGLAVGATLDGEDGADIVVGAFRASTGSTAHVGRVYVLEAGMPSGDVDLADARFSVDGAATEELIGEDITMSDLDGDGVQELVVGCRYCDDADADAGAALIIDAQDDGATSRDDGVSWYGLSSGDAAGAAVLGGLDLDGDGWEDLVISAPGVSDSLTNAGRIYVMSGPSGLVTQSLDAAWARVDGGVDGQGLADSLAGGDVDGDERDDLVVGVRNWSAAVADGGAMLIFEGLGEGTWLGEDATVVVEGVRSGMGAGDQVAVGDVTGDGVVDVLGSGLSYIYDDGSTSFTPGAVFVASEFGW